MTEREDEPDLGLDPAEAESVRGGTTPVRSPVEGEDERLRLERQHERSSHTLGKSAKDL